MLLAAAARQQKRKAAHLLDALFDGGAVCIRQHPVAHAAVVVEALLQSRPNREVHPELLLQGQPQHVAAAVPKGLQVARKPALRSALCAGLLQLNDSSDQGASQPLVYVH